MFFLQLVNDVFQRAPVKERKKIAHKLQEARPFDDKNIMRFAKLNPVAIHGDDMVAYIEHRFAGHIVRSTLHGLSPCPCFQC